MRRHTNKRSANLNQPPVYRMRSPSIYGYTHPIKITLSLNIQNFTVLTVSIIYKIELIRAGRCML
jgi:hypothetical protein